MSSPTDLESETPLSALMSTLLPAVLARGGDWLGVKDARSGRYVHANAAMAQALGGVVGKADAELFDAEQAAAMRLADQTALAQREPVISDHRIELGGSRHEFSVLRLGGESAEDGRRFVCSVWSDRSGELRRETQLRQALEQIEHQQRANEQLRKELADQALRDPATGLYTRAHFEDQLRREVDLSTREHREFAAVVIELDAPSEKVRALGPAADGRILEAMGRLLRGGTRAMDASCRFDERRFAVLLSGVGLATAHARMESLRRQCATQVVVHEGRELRLTVSMGVASFPHTASTQEELLAACDKALAEAQRRGGNHVTLAAIRFEG